MTDWFTAIQKIGLAKGKHAVFMGIIYIRGVPGIPQERSPGGSLARWCPRHCSDLSLNRANKHGRMVCCINLGSNNSPAQVFISGVCLIMVFSWNASLPPHFKRYPSARLEILSGWECEWMVCVLRWTGPDVSSLSAASGMDSSTPPWPNKWVLTEPYHQHSSSDKSINKASLFTLLFLCFLPVFARLQHLQEFLIQFWWNPSGAAWH